tara:strand:- start:824 stop:2104 length:1281 start_codon:yes stop_codon:yes gene_type:complete
VKNFSEFLKVKNGESLQEENKSSSSTKKTKVEKEIRGEKKISVVKKQTRRGRSSLLGGTVDTNQQINPDDIAKQNKINQTVSNQVKSAEKSGNISSFTDKPIEGAPNTKTLVRGAGGETIANPVTTSKKTAEKTARVSTSGTDGQVVKNQSKFATDTQLVKPEVTTTGGKTVTGTTSTGRPSTAKVISKVDQKTAVDDLTRTTNKVNKVKTLTPRQLGNVAVKNKAQSILKDLSKEKKIDDVIKSRNISKQIVKSRDLKRQGFGDTRVARTIDKKITALKPQVNITNPKIVRGTTDAAQKYGKLIKKAKFNRGLRTLGRAGGALTSFLDFKATADKEKRLGRGKTSQTVGGLSRALGGYVGGAIGAGLAAPIPIPGARIAGAVGGYTAGAAAGEKLYNVGRKFLTRGTKIGGKTFKDFKNIVTRKK